MTLVKPPESLVVEARSWIFHQTLLPELDHHRRGITHNDEKAADVEGLGDVGVVAHCEVADVEGFGNVGLRSL